MTNSTSFAILAQNIKYLLPLNMVAQWQRLCLPMWVPREMQVQSLGWEDPLEEEMATHSSIAAEIIPWAEDPGRL